MQFKEKVLYDSFPRQRLPEKKKTPRWRAKCVNWGADRDVLHFSPVRKSVEHKQINYDLLNGKLHMSDLKMVAQNRRGADFHRSPARGIPLEPV